MDSEDGIEKLLMMEMEREVEKAKPKFEDPYMQRSTLPPPFEITPIDDRIAQKEEDAIQAEIERRLRAKQEERAKRGSAASPFNTPKDTSFGYHGNNFYGQDTRGIVEADDIQHQREFNVNTQLEANELELVQREAEERARKEAAERAQREAAEQAKREAAERAQREAAEQAQREAAERAQREAAEQAQREAAERAQREAEERARKEAAERAQREAAERAQREAEERARKEAAEQAQREAAERAQREAAEQAKREAEERAQREAEERARKEAAERAQREAAEQAQREAEERARKEAAEQAQREAEERARKEAAERALGKAAERGQGKVEDPLQLENSANGALSCGDDVESSNGSSVLHRGEEGNSSSSFLGSKTEKGDNSTDEYETISDLSHFSSLITTNTQNDNGILSGGSSDVTVTFSEENILDEAFEVHALREMNRLGIADFDVRSRRIECHQYETIREPGRCLYPPGEEREGDLSSSSIQLGFFRAKQVIISSSIPRQKRIAEREQHGDSDRRPLSTLHCFFESELVQDPSVTFDDEDLPHNASSECMITEKELTTRPPNGSVNKSLSKISFGDPIQVWEKTRDRSFDLLSTPGDNRRRLITYTGGPTANIIWAGEGDTKKPTPAVKVFSGGVPLRVECKKIGGPMMDIHGSDVDPVVISLAFYSINSNNKIKVSETFFFDSAVDIFYPHKERKDLNRENRAVAFIPQEFLFSLYLVVRVYRPASEDYDTYVDLYSRPDRYKSQHVIPMKQETQLLAITSDTLEELGWGVMQCSREKKTSETIGIKKLYRKAIDDSQLYQLVDDERSRNALRTVPFELEFTIYDCRSHEVAFPSQYNEPHPEENETIISLLDPEVPGARADTCRYVPCAIPILNSGFFHAYHNVFYFRLSKVKVINTGLIRKIPNTHRTYVMQICVKDQDVSLGEEGLPLIYGRRLSGQTLETSSWTSTIHNSSEFELSDEFKIQLPLYLTDTHHIFITLYASYQKRNPPTAGQQRLYKIGYAAFPICRNGVIQVKDDWSINFVSVDQAVVVAAGGYLTKFPEAPPSALLNNGLPVIHASTQTRTSIHASNKTIAAVFKETPIALASIAREEDALKVSGRLDASINATDDEINEKVLNLMKRLPLAEILAFYPFLLFYNLALISSSSNSVSLKCRTSALDALIDMTFKAHQYDMSSRVGRRQQSEQSSSSSPGVVKTSVTMILYHHLTNNVLYNGQRYRIYAGVAEAWISLLSLARNETSVQGENETSGGPNKGSTIPQRSIKKQMAELSWFLFDVILRSLYLWALENPNIPRMQLFDPSFYNILGKLCTEVLDVLNGFVGGGILVQRVALFVRNLNNYCDRGRVLIVYNSVVNFFEQTGDMEGLCAFLKITLEDPDSLTLMLPSPVYTKPVFLTRVLVDALSKLLIHRDRDTRAGAANMIYSFLCSLTNNPRIPSVTLRWIASQLFSLLRSVSAQWKTYLQMCSKIDTNIAINDKRQIAVTMLWILYYTPRSVINQWLVNEEDSKILVGFMNLITDTQSILRYNGGTDKADLKESKSNISELREWDARMSTFATAIGSRICSIILEDIPHSLQTLRKEKPSVVVFPFFVMLESIVHLGNSTIALQFSSSALFEVVCSLFPEIVSRTARMSSGMVLLTFRLMSSCCQYVRAISGQTFFLMSQSYFTWSNSLSRIKSLTANALVSVAESKVRNLRLAGRFIEFQFEDLLEKARRDGEKFISPSLDYNSRYENDSNQPGGDSGVKYQYNVEPLFLSVQRRIPISQYLLESDSSKTDNSKSIKKNGSGFITGGVQEDEKNPPCFADEFAAMSESTLSLFRDVLYLQMDSSMRFKEAKVFAYFEVVKNFLRQNSLREVLKWLHRLHETHKSNGNMAEAGMVLLFTGALCFRVTEVFYHIKGKDSRGARMPYGLLAHVFWHDYVRVLPEVDVLLPVDTVYAIVSELYVCPDDSCFSVEGQVKALREAAENLDKDHYYEFSIGTISIVDKYLRAIGDFKAAAAVHAAISTWCTAISQQGNRHNHRYYLLWARMEREEHHNTRHEAQEDIMLDNHPRGLPAGRAIKRVYKMPTATPLQEFKEYSKSFITSLFEDANLVVLTDELTDTLPALPEPTSRKKRVAALHQSPNHCLVTVFEVHASFAKGVPVPPDGFDKSMHIDKFENIMHVRSRNDEVVTSKTIDLMSQRMLINTYELDRAFPSTTSAIDVKKTNAKLLDPFETAKETLNHRIDIIKQASENDALISIMRDALSPMGITPPGAYMKEVINTMNSNTEVIDTVKVLSTILRKKISICEKLNAPIKHPDDYALVLKAVTDIECCLIAMVDSSLDDVERDD